MRRIELTQVNLKSAINVGIFLLFSWIAYVWCHGKSIIHSIWCVTYSNCLWITIGMHFFPVKFFTMCNVHMQVRAENRLIARFNLLPEIYSFILLIRMQSIFLLHITFDTFNYHRKSESIKSVEWMAITFNGSRCIVYLL